MGDETAVVQGSFHPSDEIKVNAVLKFISVRAKVYRGRIVINTIKPNSIFKSEFAIAEVNQKLNISDRKWADINDD
jgi:hypothetical protein